MLVKASGTWLADAETKDIMVPVDIARLRAALKAGDPAAENNAAYVPEGENPSGLRPSIETSVHAIFDWPVVLHTHCVATIATAVRADAARVVEQRLGDLGAAFIPYVKPGLSLARAIDDAAGAETRVLVLGNHGLAVGAETAPQAEALLREVSRRLTPELTEQPHREGANPDTPTGLAGAGWQLFDHAATTALARNQTLLSRIEGASFYPDHVIFLGPGLLVAAENESPQETVARARQGAAQNLIVFPGLGAALPDDASPAVRALAGCIGEVALCLDPEAELLRLTAEQEADLINWDAEKYRQALELGPS